MNIVVSDTSPIRALAFLGKISILHDLFGQVIVPPSVAEELHRCVARPGPIDVGQWSYFEVREPLNGDGVLQLTTELDLAEAEAIVLAQEIGASFVLIDEQLARTVAQRVGLSPVGTLGVLLRAKEQGLVTELRPLIERLHRELRFFLSQHLIDDFLRLANE